MAKPTVFISHIHAEESYANALEAVLKQALLGALDIFNSSNRKSISAGDPWRDRIIDTLRDSTCILVLASPDSVSSPWVNFESGGAWVSGTRVIPCCIKGMEPSSLPAPLSHLQAITPASPDDLQLLVKHLADLAGLDNPSDFNFETAANTLSDNSGTEPTADDNAQLLEWYSKARRRPIKHKGETSSGFFKISSVSGTDRQETEQFHGEGLKAGDSITFHLSIEGEKGAAGFNYHAFANGDVADLLEDLPPNTRLHGTLKCIGQLKVYDFDMPSFEHEDRGISYHAAWLVTEARKA